MSLVKKHVLCAALILFCVLPLQLYASASNAPPSCRVSGVDENDVLNIREQPNARSDKIGSIPFDGADVERISEAFTSKGATWFNVRYQDVTGWVNSRFIECRYSSAQARSIINDLAGRVLRSLKQKDMKQFAAFVHPVKGVRFSPYGYVDTDSDQVLSAAMLPDLLKTKQKRVWGYYDGSGDDILLSFADYYQRFVYSHDFLNAPQVAFNQSLGSGNTLNNLTEVYPNAIFVEYYFPDLDPQTYGTNWASLRLVFEQMRGQWYVVGVIHDQWTI